jgi:oligopeptide/dipeptide ABC transporter ATP-binding protein
MVILDEPTSALDVSVQAKIMNLLSDLQKEYDLTYLFISHNLGVIRHASNSVVVMYLGRVVEAASKGRIFDHPAHPYTRLLLSSVPVPNPRMKRKRIQLEGDVPSPANPPSGCRFHPRCPQATSICTRSEPKLIDLAPDHRVSCHLYSAS